MLYKALLYTLQYLLQAHTHTHITRIIKFDPIHLHVPNCNRETSTTTTHRIIMRS